MKHMQPVLDFYKFRLEALTHLTESFSSKSTGSQKAKTKENQGFGFRSMADAHRVAGIYHQTDTAIDKVTVRIKTKFKNEKFFVHVLQRVREQQLPAS